VDYQQPNNSEYQVFVIFHTSQVCHKPITEPPASPKILLPIQQPEPPGPPTSEEKKQQNQACARSARSPHDLPKNLQWIIGIHVYWLDDSNSA
jgi:hypothetical protein